VSKKTGKVKSGFVLTTFDEFKNWIGPSGIPGQCFYCGISSLSCGNLYHMQMRGVRYNATRGGKRGRRLELDRRDASKEYDELDNLVWCCYWYNNAKSNFFTELEFMPVAKAIGKVLQSICQHIDS